MDTDERLTDLEIRLAYQERLIENLNEVVREFAGRVETLERNIRALRDSSGDVPIGGAQEKPPHY